jgi:ATP-dependent RNA helicase DOB1
VIVFSFSKRECDNLAKGCLTLDLTTDDEKAAIQRVYDAAVDMLSQVGRRGHMSLI